MQECLVSKLPDKCQHSEANKLQMKNVIPVDPIPVNDQWHTSLLKVLLETRNERKSSKLNLTKDQSNDMIENYFSYFYKLNHYLLCLKTEYILVSFLVLLFSNCLVMHSIVFFYLEWSTNPLYISSVFCNSSSFLTKLSLHRIALKNKRLNIAVFSFFLKKE